MSTKQGTPPRYRQYLPQPTAPDAEQGWTGELEAVDALYAAFMALNSAGRNHAGREALAMQDGLSSPMSLTARAARAALARIYGVGDQGARAIWDQMNNSGDPARHCYDLWREGQI